MIKTLLTFFTFFLLSNLAYTQKLSFTCAKDTVLGCGVNCFDLVVRIPDLRAVGNDYTIEEVSNAVPCYPQVDPGAPGTSTNLLMDDLYSSVIALPFPFTFYGVTYNSLIASTNGYVCFDVGLTGTFSHWDDLGDLPNLAYDPAIIMGPYHDLDPSISSPGQQIKYDVYGVAPNRKWVLSFYKVPLYDCPTLSENTHQIILNETSNIIEVVVRDVQNCGPGKAMIGIQDDTQTKGLMAKNRKMSDPQWGIKGLNETYRFYPIGGAPLYRKMELLNAAGTVIATGDTTRLGAAAFSWTFSNICPAANTPTLYVVKTTYARMDNPALTYYSLDTVRVLKNALPLAISANNTDCGVSTGTITVTPTGGTAPLSYSLDGGSGQPGSTFLNVSAGSHAVKVTDATGCSNTITVIVGINSSLTATSTAMDASCPGVNNGSIIVNPTSGTAPYTYSLNGGLAQVSNTFLNLPPGTYNVGFIDASGCNGSFSQLIGPGSLISGNAQGTPTSCAGNSDGVITVNGTNGVGPYQYSLDGGPLQLNNSFTNLAPGSYAILIQDSKGCTYNLTEVVSVGSGLLANTVVNDATCTGAADGSITVNISNGSGPYLYSLNGGTPQASNIFNGLTTGAYNISFSDANFCSGDMPVNVGFNTILFAALSATATSCPSVNDGTITLSPNGSGPYTFTLNPGNITQLGNVFTGLAPGAYTLTFTNAIGCAGVVSTTPIIVNAGAAPTASVNGIRNVACANLNDGSATINPSGSGPYTYTLNPGSITQASPTFNGLAPGAYTYSFQDAAGCSGTGSFVITGNPALRMPALKTMPLCKGAANGSINFNALGGLAPYQFALAPFSSFQTSTNFTGLTAGNYQFRIKDAAGCTKDTSITLTEPTTVTSFVSNTKSATCNGNDGTITVTANGGTPGYTYSLNNGFTYQSSPILVAPDTGLYPNIKVKDANGCTSNSSAIVALTDTMRLSLGADQTICVESNITLQPLTNPGTTIFTWTALNAGISTLSSSSIKNPIATPVDTTTYRLLAQWGLCSRQDDITINVLHKPIPNAGLDTAICNQQTQNIPSVATLTGSAGNLSGTVNYSWSPASKVNSPNTSVTTAKTDSTQLFVLTVTDNYGCNFSVTDTVTVFVQKAVIAFAGRDTIAMLGKTHQLVGTGGTSYFWQPASVLNSATSRNPLATLLQDTRFTLVVKDEAGCEGYDTVFVKVYDGPAYYIPNTFTPNGDGRNDIFRPIPAGLASTDWFRVFDRGGNVLFETNQWLKGWDGTYRGQKQPMGTYVWMIKGRGRDGKVIQEKGTVILLH